MANVSISFQLFIHCHIFVTLHSNTTYASFYIDYQWPGVKPGVKLWTAQLLTDSALACVSIIASKRPLSLERKGHRVKSSIGVQTFKQHSRQANRIQYIGYAILVSVPQARCRD